MRAYPQAVHDNRGTEISVGCRVAYNLSGQIGVGVVREIRDATRNGYRHPLFLITPEWPEWARRQSESKVRDQRSVLVIERPPEIPSALTALLEDVAGSSASDEDQLD